MTETATRYGPRDANAVEPGEAIEPSRSDMQGQAPAESSMSVTGLVRKLVNDVSYLFRKELALATSEVVEAVDGTKAGIVNLIGGAALLYGGILFLLGAAAIGLTEFMALWAAVLTVGAVTTVVGLIMVQVGKKKASPRQYAPERTAEALRRDREMIQRQTS